MIAFATLKGRFVLATKEQLLLQTIANIKARTGKDRLSEEPAFKTLAATMAPHFATVWVDQTKLNDDYYFKHYWLQQNVSQMKGLRAGMFDVELQNGKWIERRDFLTTPKVVGAGGGLPVAEVQRLRALVPDGVPFLKVQSLHNDLARVGPLVRDTLLDRIAPDHGSSRKLWSWASYGEDGFYGAQEGEDSSEDSYGYLNSDYDTAIDDPRAARLTSKEEPGGNPLSLENEKEFQTRLGQAMGPAQPMAAVVATSPRTMTGPLFVEFQRVAIITLQTPASLNLEVLEGAIAKLVQGRVAVNSPGAETKWVRHEEGARAWRELDLPLLGWKFCYAIQDRELILANSPELLAAVFATRANPASQTPQPGALLDDLTVIRFDQRKQAFDDIVGRLDAEEVKRQQVAFNKNPNEAVKPSDQFFSGEIGSLLDVAGNVRQLEIHRSSSGNRLHEEIDYVFK